MQKTLNQGYTGYNKIVYGVFIVVALIFIIRNEFGDSIIYAGLALAFDPFDTTVPFNKRPLWQRAWLVVHLVAVLVLLCVTLIK